MGKLATQEKNHHCPPGFEPTNFHVLNKAHFNHYANSPVLTRGGMKMTSSFEGVVFSLQSSQKSC